MKTPPDRNSPRVVLCSFPDREQAKEIATRCIQERLAACVSVLPGVESVYQWKGAVETASEILAIFKTTATAYPALEERLKALHPYEVPEIIALDVTEGLPSYLQWISAETQDTGQ